MEKQLRYQGEFFSVADVLWRVEIWQDADTPYPVVGELRFPSDTPLSFEWFETDKWNLCRKRRNASDSKQGGPAIQGYVYR